MKRKHVAIVGIILVFVTIMSGWLILSKQNSKPAEAVKDAATKSSAMQAASTTKGVSFDKALYSLSDPTSIWVVVNKQRPLQPKTYVPSDLVVPNVPLRVPGNQTMQLRKETATALEAMVAGAKAQGYNLMLASGYRSYEYQVDLYNGYVNTQGQAQADAQSARPGYSEHQTGLSLDLRTVAGNCELDACFGDTPEGKWVAENAHTYGFIIRYPEGSKAIVGYEYEPWHVRYVGKELAQDYHASGAQTLEGYFNLPSAADY